jgi:hypothetical protein
MVANPLVLRPLRRCVDSPALAVASQKCGVSPHASRFMVAQSSPHGRTRAPLRFQLTRVRLACSSRQRGCQPTVQKRGAYRSGV